MLCTGDEVFSKSTCLFVLSGNSHFSYGQFGTLTLKKWSSFFKAGFAFDAILQRSQKIQPGDMKKNVTMKVGNLWFKSSETVGDRGR